MKLKGKQDKIPKLVKKTRAEEVEQAGQRGRGARTALYNLVPGTAELGTDKIHKGNKRKAELGPYTSQKEEIDALSILEIQRRGETPIRTARTSLYGVQKYRSIQQTKGL
jgi:hypothetical protein